MSTFERTCARTRAIAASTLLTMASCRRLGRLSVSIIALVLLAPAGFAFAQAQGFSATDSMKEARSQHTATLLDNGTVLVTGGGSATAEIYNPSTGLWRYTRYPMTYSRYAHTAVKMKNGKVLIAGGGSPLPGEIFDPVTETFTLTTSTNALHFASPGILLSDGRVLVITGSQWFFGTGVSEIYNPSTASWTATPSIPVGFSVMAGVGLPDGTVLAMEGYDGYTRSAYPYVQKYVPATNTVVEMANAIVPRLQHTATLMPDGKVLIVAGSDPSYSVASTELYDPTASPNGQSQLSTSLNQGRRGHTATLLPNGDVLVVGGFQSAHGCCFAANLSSAELRGSSSGAWSLAGDTAVRRGYGHSATLLPSGAVLVAGGTSDSNTLTDTAEIWKPLDGTPPIVVSQVNGTSGNNGWYRSNVSISWNVTDPESGIASSSGCSPTTLTNSTAGVTLTCSASNGAGYTTSVPVTVKIDQTPPLISGMPAAGCSLWPPNKKLVQVATVTASDLLSGLTPGSLKVTGISNEPSDPSDPAIVVTPNGSGGFNVQLQADRLGTGSGRTYTLTANASDLAGNATTATATCVVPHDKGK